MRAVSAFGDASLFLFVSTGVFRRDEPEEGHEFLGMLKAAEGANLADGDHGGDELKAFE